MTVTARFKNETIPFSDLDSHMHIETFKSVILRHQRLTLPTSYVLLTFPTPPYPQLDPSKTIAELSLEGGIVDAQILGMLYLFLMGLIELMY